MSMELIISPLSLATVTFNREELAARVAEINARYAGVVVTDKAAAKTDRAEINKILKQIDEARKTVKRQYEAPLKQFAAELAEVVAPLTETRDTIDAAVKAIEEQERETRRAVLEAAYNEADHAVPLDRVLDPRWLNTSVSAKKAVAALMEALKAADADIATIKGFYSPHGAALLDRYMHGATLQEVVEYKRQLDTQTQTFGVSGTETPSEIIEALEQENPNNTYTMTDTGIQVVGKPTPHTITVSCTDGQLDEIERVMQRHELFYMID